MSKFYLVVNYVLESISRKDLLILINFHVCSVATYKFQILDYNSRYEADLNVSLLSFISSSIEYAFNTVAKTLFFY